VRLRLVVTVVAAVAMLSSVAFLVLARPARVADPAARGSDHSAHGPDHATMTEAGMEEWARAWWASHPPVGMQSAGPPAATFRVGSFFFDNDDNLATQVDTARITVGESVLWQWVDGVHTITSGIDNNDKDAGALFDQPSASGAQQFNFAFTTTGTFPFFCRPHDFLQMKGIVIVSSTTGVDPHAGPGIGFTSAPAPNPARTGVTFGFALREAGWARAEVFDAGGRRVALVLDRDLAAGPHVGAWDGRVNGRVKAGPGLYYVRLRIPGYSASRAIVIAR